MTVRVHCYLNPGMAEDGRNSLYVYAFLYHLSGEGVSQTMHNLSKSNGK